MSLQPLVCICCVKQLVSDIVGGGLQPYNLHHTFGAVFSFHRSSAWPLACLSCLFSFLGALRLRIGHAIPTVVRVWTACQGRRPLILIQINQRPDMCFKFLAAVPPHISAGQRGQLFRICRRWKRSEARPGGPCGTCPGRSTLLYSPRWCWALPARRTHGPKGVVFFIDVFSCGLSSPVRN